MPIAPAHARKLLRRGMAQRQPHHAFTILRLNRSVDNPSLRPVRLDIAIHKLTAELHLVAESARGPIPLLWLLVDLQTDIARRLRRRAGHRRRRKGRQRYHAPPRQGVPFKLRRPSMARSSWARLHRKKGRQRARLLQLAPTIRWRAQAILRTVDALCKLVPLSHVTIYAPRRLNVPTPTGQTPAERREQLLSQTAKATCAYCGRPVHRLEVDHVQPRARGGTDALANLILACAACNTAKGDQPIAPPLAVADRQRPQLWQTAYLLQRVLERAEFDARWLSTNETIELERVTERQKSSQGQPAQGVLVKPIPRPRKQRFTARNYPLSTPLRLPFVRVSTTVKRLVRVNQHLLVQRQKNKTDINIIAIHDSHQKREGQMIKLGMLCEGRRAGQLITGIVGAIHSTGRLSLRVPNRASVAGIHWQDVTISPRTHLRIRSTDRVIFLPLPAVSAAASANNNEST